MDLQEQHNIDIKELNILEDELGNYISSMGNQSMMDKFLEWQTQRIKCNQGFNDILKEGLDNLPKFSQKICYHPKEKRTTISGVVRCDECGKEIGFIY